MYQLPIAFRHLNAALRRLPEFPHASRFDERFGAHLRSVPPYIIAYTITDDAIQIIRVVDARRDLEAVFSPL